jgi:hypothetical protein
MNLIPHFPYPYPEPIPIGTDTGGTTTEGE